VRGHGRGVAQVEPQVSAQVEPQGSTPQVSTQVEQVEP
jgi:hypothetical protein